MNDYKKHTICPIPWYHMSIQQNGDFRICCQNIDPPYGKLKKDQDEFLNVQTDSWDNVRNHATVKELRKSMIDGEKHPLCNLCWTEEKNNLNSKRIFMNEVLVNTNKTYDIEFIKNNTNPDGSIDASKFPINYFDLRFGNLCNLKCRSCGPTDSSLWYEDFHILNGNPNKPRPMKFYGLNKYTVNKNDKVYELRQNNNSEITNDFSWYENDFFINQFENNLENVERIYFTGGEPTINKAHFKLLEMCIEKGVAKNINLEYNTNMYAIPDKLYDLWEKFKFIQIGCSIDGINQMANYLRPPSTWDIIEKNLDKLENCQLKNVYATLSPTISVYNIFNFLELTQWLLNKNYKLINSVPSFHMLVTPGYMSVQVLPPEFKHFVTFAYEKFYQEIENNFDVRIANIFRKKFNGIIQHMNAADNSHLLSKLKIETTKIDVLRKQNINDVASWLTKLLVNK